MLLGRLLWCAHRVNILGLSHTGNNPVLWCWQSEISERPEAQNDYLDIDRPLQATLCAECVLTFAPRYPLELEHVVRPELINVVPPP